MEILEVEKLDLKCNQFYWWKSFLIFVATVHLLQSSIKDLQINQFAFLLIYSSVVQSDHKFSLSNFNTEINQ